MSIVLVFLVVDGCYWKGMSLEKAIEILLTWPPIPYHGQPQPVILELRTDIRLKYLKQRTIQVVQI
jgi:hypothetical protein